MKVFNFMGWRLAAVVFSGVLLLTAIGSLAVRQLEWGLDFTGGYAGRGALRRQRRPRRDP